jgi:hypothetical protein
MKSVAMLLIGILIGVGMQAVVAKEFADKVVISGAGLPQDIEITGDICTLRALSYGNLEDPTMRVNGTPEVEGEGYLITRYWQTFDGYQPLDQVRFYHDPRGGRGYVYDMGMVDGSDSAVEGEWFRPNALSQFMMEYLLLNPSGYAQDQEKAS